MVRLDEVGATYPGYVASYEIDHVNYGVQAPWPTEPDGSGPALIRIHTADYGNDVANWGASNMGGTPGKANLPLDTSAPTVPTNLTGHATISPNKITLNWTASTDSQSNVDHYVVYRNGSAIDTAASTSYSDTNVQTGTNYVYSVSAVNRDGYESGQSATLTAGVPGILSYDWPDSQHVAVYFSEALDPAVAGVLSNYLLGGGTFTAVALSRGNTLVTLTTAAAMTTGAGYTVTMSHLTTASGDVLPTSLQFSFSYAPQGTGSILREYWANIGSGINVADLTSNANYPNNPSGRTLLTSFEAPVNWADDYGTRIQGYLSPPMTGYYTFWIAADDTGELWLSTDDNPANKVKIAYVLVATGSRDWNNSSDPYQKSAQIYLQAGQRYYVEALQKESSGNDNLAVRWQLPDGSWENGDSTIPIPGIRLSPYGGIDFTPPTTPASLWANFNVAGQISLAWSPASDPESGVDHYVIYRDGKAYATSTTTSYTDSSLGTQSWHSYQVSAVNYDNCEGARSQTDTVMATSLLSVVATDLTSVQVTFTQPVDRLSAETAANYSLTGVTIYSAQLATDNLSVTLTTSSLSTISHLFTVSNVKTSGGVTIPTKTAIVSYTGKIDYDYWLNIGSGTAVSDLTSNPNYPDNPTGHQVLTSFDAPYNWADDYGGRIRGYIFPQTTGYYTFWIASDDNGQLWLSTDSNPANKVEIAYVPGATGHNVWNLYPQQQSASIYLVAGQRYYIEALEKDGTGGDNLSVAWQRPGTTFNPSNGTPIGGLFLAPFNPLAPWSVIGVNPLFSNDTQPALSGTVDSTTATILVAVAGTYYPAINNGDGTWTLPKGEIAAPLPNGTYNVWAAAIDSAGHISCDTTSGELVIDTVTPTVSVAAGNPRLRVAAVSSLTIQFSEPVVGFSLADLQFTLGGISQPLSAATLTTTDQQTWTLGNLAGLTAALGTYQLTLTAAGSGITDLAGNPLLVGGSTAWRNVPPIPGDFNLDGVVDGLDKAIWFANVWTGKTWAQGDANGDGTVNGLDWDILVANFGRSVFDEYPAPPLPPTPSPTSGPSLPSGRTPVQGPVAPIPIGGSSSLLSSGGATPAPAGSGEAAVSPSAAAPTTAAAPEPATTATVQVAVAVAPPSASLGTGSIVAPQTSPPIAAVLYVGAGPGLPPNASSPPTTVVQTTCDAQNQSVTVLTVQAKPVSASSQPSSSSVSTSGVPSPSIAVQTAHDAVFTQIEQGSCSVAAGLLAGGTTSPAANLASALSSGKVGTAAATSPKPQTTGT